MKWNDSEDALEAIDRFRNANHLRRAVQMIVGHSLVGDYNRLAAARENLLQSVCRFLQATCALFACAIRLSNLIDVVAAHNHDYGELFVDHRERAVFKLAAHYAFAMHIR